MNANARTLTMRLTNMCGYALFYVHGKTMCAAGIRSEYELMVAINIYTISIHNINNFVNVEIRSFHTVITLSLHSLHI